MTNHPAGSATRIDLAALCERMYEALPASPADAPDDSHELWAIYAEMRALARATPQHIPGNFTSHRAAWRKAIELAIANTPSARFYGDEDQKAYWQHELAAYDRSFARLLDNPEPVRPAATPQHSVTEQDEPVAAQFKMPGETWEECSIYEEEKMRILGHEFRYLYSRIQPLASTVATQPEQASDDGPDLSNIEIPAGDRNGNAYEQLCAAWHSNPCGDTLTAIGSAILALRPMYEPPLADDILIMQKANEFLPRSEEVGEWAGDIDGIIGFAQFFKAYGGALAIPASTAATQPDDIRAAGWTVAVHNDYRLNGEAHTFWLFTKGDRAVKGEGKTDAEALAQVRAALAITASTVPKESK